VIGRAIDVGKAVSAENGTEMACDAVEHWLDQRVGLKSDRVTLH
jgi:hypothetical protein